MEKIHGLNQKDKKKERIQIVKNIIVLSVGILLNFIACGGLTKLQSSLHLIEGIGVITQAIIYCCFIFSCLFLCKVVIRIVGQKWTLILMILGFTIWDAANGYGVWWTMVPASVIIGLCAAPLWTAQAVFITMKAERYAALNNEKASVVVTRFFGIFFAFYQSENIIGSIISSTILEPEIENGTDIKADDDIIQFCGANDCPGNNVTNPYLKEQDPTLVWIMVGTYVAIALLGAVILIIFLDSPSHNTKAVTVESEQSLREEIQHLLIATVKQLRCRKQMLILPATLVSGLEPGFAFADFNKSYITCSIGIWNVGYVSITYGVISVITSLLVGVVSKYSGRKSLFLTYFIVRLAMSFVLLFWMPHPDQVYVLHIISGLYGVARTVQLNFLCILIGSPLFSSDPEAAFCNYRMWESLGYAIAFAYSSFLCTSTKLYILIAVLIISAVGYALLEYIMVRSQHNPDQSSLELSKESEKLTIEPTDQLQSTI